MRYDVIHRVLGDLHDVHSLLEIGPGTGALGARLADRYEYTAVEPDPASAAAAKAEIGDRGRIIEGDITSLDPVPSFDLIGAFEVLEHLEDDTAALQDWVTRLRPGGWILLSVPAFQKRFGDWDVLAGHYRRYERAQLEDLMAEAGLGEIRLWTTGFPIGYLLEGVRHRIASRMDKTENMEEKTAASGRLLQPMDRFGLLTWGLALPFRMAQRPFADSEMGIGLVALARLV